MNNSQFRVLKKIKKKVKKEINKSFINLRYLLQDKKFLLSKKFKNYHLGCGELLVSNFLNIDMFSFGDYVPALPLPKYLKKTPYFFAYDLEKGIPASLNSLDVIYHSHLLEHLDHNSGILFLQNCYECLRVGGVMRFALPDLKIWCDNYVANNKIFFQTYKSQYDFGLEDSWKEYKSKGHVFSSMLYNWGHKMAYDFESLEDKLSKIGFKNINSANWGESNLIPSILELEPLQSDRKFESLVIECKKK